jgi:hypothetical protein
MYIINSLSTALKPFRVTAASSVFAALSDLFESKGYRYFNSTYAAGIIFSRISFEEDVGNVLISSQSRILSDK